MKQLGERVLGAARMLGVMAWTAVWVTVAFVASLVTLNPGVALAMARKVWGPGVLKIAGVQLEMSPLPDLNWNQPHIFVMNHQSALDIPCAFVALPVNLRFIAKHSLKYFPFVGWYMAFTGMVFVDRKNRARAVKSLRKAGQTIRNGANILAYPEGTRSKDGYIHPFKKGPFAVALEAGVPIVPVAIERSRNVLPSGEFAFRPGPVRMKMGHPIPTQGRLAGDRELLAQETHKALVDLHQALGGLGEPPRK